MCGRYALGGDASDYADFLAVDRVVTEALKPSYNVAPTDPVYVAAQWDDERLLGTMQWGFVPHWAEDRKSIQINARLETVATKPMFRDSFARKRCLIPADGFYEWEPKDVGRTPHWVYREDGVPMAFAGIYSSIKNPASDTWVRTCAIITTEASGRIASIHHRMPVALAPSVWGAWLDRRLTDAHHVASLVRPIDSDVVTEHAVTSAVNSVRNNHPDLRRPAPPETLF